MYNNGNRQPASVDPYRFVSDKCKQDFIIVYFEDNNIFTIYYPLSPIDTKMV